MTNSKRPSLVIWLCFIGGVVLSAAVNQSANIAYGIEMNLFHCGNRSVCQDRPNMTHMQNLDYLSFFGDYNCYCDDQCHFYDDCCSEEPEAVPGVSPEHTHDFSCIQEPHINKFSPVYIIKRCPSSYTDLVNKTKCEAGDNMGDFVQSVPASGLNSGLLYKNLYCATCNGDGYRIWQASVDCYDEYPLSVDSNVTMADLMENELCQFQFLPREGDLYRPCTQYVETCGTGSNSFLRSLCFGDRFDLFYTEQYSYKNIYCALCNDVQLETLQCSPFNYSMGMDKRLFLPYSFRMLVDFTHNSISRTHYSRGNEYDSESKPIPTCTHNQIYDPFKKECRGTFCNSANDTSDYCLLFFEDGTNDTVCDSFVLLENDEYSIGENGTLYLNRSSQFLNNSHYHVWNDTVFVCASFLEDALEAAWGRMTAEAMFAFSKVEAILSFTGVVLSLCCLAITIATYAYFDSLRNIPGKNMLALSGTLFAAQLLFLIAPYCVFSFSLCKTVAIAMHLSFLTAFLWMNIMSFDVYITFSRSFVRSGVSGKSSKRFICYMAYSLFTSSAIVAAAILLDDVWSETRFQPMYGIDVCWIRNPDALLLLFGGPLATIMASNAILFVLTSRHLYIAHKNAGRVSDEKRSNFFIYVKLSVIMGLTWIFGFIANLSGNNVVWYAFIVFNTLQGVFIWMSFFCTKKVLRMIRERIDTARSIRTLSKDGVTVESNLSDF